MPDLRQVLREFVSTSNSGKYATEEELMSKFPELQGYDIQVLREFVATSNSGKYSDEETLFSKFPEFKFDQQQPVTQATQPLVPMSPLKKKEASTSPSESGVLERYGFNAKRALGQEEQKPIMTQPLPERLQPAQKKDSKTWERETALPEVITDYTKPAEEVSLLRPKEKPAEEPLGLIGRYVPERDEKKTPKFIEETLSALTPDKFNLTGTEPSKKALEYYLKDMGFKIEDSDKSSSYAGKYVNVISPSGEKHLFYLGNEIIRKETFGYAGLPSEDDIEQLKDFVRASAFSDSSIAKKEYLYEKENKKFKTKESIDNEVKDISAQEQKFQDDYKSMLALQKDIEDIEKDLKRWEDFGEQNTPKYIQTKAYLNDKIKEYNDYIGTLKNKEAALSTQAQQLEKSMGKYFEFQSTQGSFEGTLYRSIAESSANIFSNYLRAATSRTIDALPMSALMDEDLYKEERLRKLKEKGYEDGTAPQSAIEEVDAEIRDRFKKAAITGKVGEEKLQNVLTVQGVRESLKDFVTSVPVMGTSEYKERREKEGGFVERGVIGLAGSLPAMVGNRYLRLANMFMMTTDAVMQEMDNDPSFANVSENEKELIAAPIGVIGAALEEIGLRNLIKGTSVTSSIVKSVLGRVPSNATASTIRKATFDAVKEMGLRGTVALAGATLAEAETGAAQQISEYAVKDIYNAMKGEKRFDNPAFLSGQYFYDIYDAARTEAVGGFVMGVPYSAAAAFKKDGFRGLDDETFKIFEQLAKDNDSKKFFVTDLKNKINRGEITPQQGKQILDAYNEASGMIGVVPDEITDTESRKIAMDLLSERKKLEAKKQGKDDALAKPIQDKINQINEQLSKLTEDAIQKQAAGEVSIQPETGAGQEVEVGGPEAKPKITPEESKRKEDLVAALEATDKDVIAIGDELLDRKEAQAELEAITQKEQAAVIEQGGMEQAPAKMTTTEVLTATPTETKASVTFVAPDGNEVALEGNEQVAAQLYDEAVAVAEEQRTPEQNDIIQKMQPIVAAAPAVEVTPAEVTPAAEVTPVEQQFTEQDRARKAELEEAMRKADKRKKNITVGETTMTKAEAKAELDALNQKEQAVQQPVTPAVEVAPTEVAPTETRTAEQEADLLEELLTGKKKEPTVTEVKAEPTSKEAIAKRLRGKKNKGLMSSIDFGISQALYNGALEFMASQVEKGTKLGNAIENTIKWIDEKMQGKSWDKDGFTKYANQIFEEPIDNITESASIKNKEAIDALIEMYNNELESAENNKKKEIINQAKKAINVLNSILPNFDIIIHYNESNYKKTIKEELGGTEEDQKSIGIFAYDVDKEGNYYGSIHVNLEKADTFTVDHELGHAIMLKFFGENYELFKDFKDKISKVLSESSNKYLTDFSNKYGENIKYEEYIVELTSLLANQKSKIEPTILMKIGSVINNIVSKITNGLFKPFENVKKTKEIIDFLNNISNSIKKGEGINIKAKSLADAVRKNLKIKGPGGLQSNILGIPVAIWNAGVETAAKAIDASVVVSKAIQQGANDVKNWIKKNNPSLSLSDAKIKNKILIDLYENTIKIARENNVKTEGLITYFKRKGLSDAQIDVLIKDEKKKAEKPELSEDTLPGYTKLMNRINDIIARGRRNGKTDDDIMKGVIANVESRSPEYANATDQQREQIIRDIRKLFGKKEKAAPSAEKITGKPKPKKVTVNDMTALKDQLRLEAKAAREAKGDLNAKRKMLTAAIKEMQKKGKITVRQAAVLINKVNSVNLDNPVMVERLLDYAEKVFNDAAYAEKLSQANKLQSQIKQLSKNKDKFGNLTAFAAEFAKIDPALVENIDEYIEMASKVKEGVQGSKTVNGKVIPADMVDVGKAMEYVNKTMKAQEETIRLKTAERLQELIGVDVSDLSMAKLQELMELVKAEALATGDQKKDLSDKINDIFGTNKDKEKAIRDGIQRMFDTYSTIIKDMFETGVDPFSDPDNPTTVEFKESDKKIVEEFMAMDLSLLDKKEALRAADALNNFLTNKSTAGMSAMLGEYDGRKNSKEVNEKGIRAKPIKMYWVPILGRSFYEQFASIPLFFEKLFKGVTRGNYVREKMGINSLVNHKAEALTLANRIINNYVIEFTKKKPNNKKFQDIYNIIERGIIGDLAKTIVGDEKQVAEEFNRRKKLIEETIQILEKGGTKKETKEAKVIKEVYDKIAKDSKTIEEVKAKADQTNVAAVQFWVDQWAKLYDQFADVALNVYNRVLDKSVNYVPDRFGFLERAEKVTKDADGFESMFFANSNSEYFYKKEAGSLMKSQPPKSLFKDGESDMYVNLSFDTNNANALLEALIDIKTARDIRQIQAFKNDPNFKEIVPNGNDAKVLKERISALIRNIRNKRIITDKTFRQLTRNIDRFASFGAALALAGPTQAIKQTIPVAVNTFINSGGKLNLSNISNKDVNDFINNSGMAIANRGLDATTELETLNQKLEQAADTKAGDLVRAIENINKKFLKVFLSNFDVFIARASWITYYEKSLRKQGVKGKIDYSTHKINQQAADYAQTMVDRQQNISDKDLAGRMYESGNPMKQFIVKVFLPLATFRMNQTTRMMNDVTVITSKTSSWEDRKIALRSFAGYAAEMATFRAIGIGVSYGLLYSIAQFIRGEDEDEEEKQKKFNNLIKGAATSVVSDVFSPMPQADMPVKYLFSSVLDQIQSIGDIKEEDRLNIFTENKESLSTAYGMFGIGLDKFNKLWEDIELGVTGKFKDDYGREKTIREKDRELLTNPLYVAIHLTSDFGISPFGPETNNVMNNITKMIKKDAMTEKQLEEYKETGEYPTKKSEAAKEEERVKKSEAYGGYETLKEFEEKDPIKYDEYSAPGGKLYQYREDERKEKEEKNKDQPFRGLSEKKFKELYPEEWRKNYGPGTNYYKSQRTPEMLQKKAQEKRDEAKRERERKMKEAIRKREENIRKALSK